MKMVLICPGERPAMASLTEVTPLAQLPVLGKTLLEHWLENFANQGIKEVLVLAPDRAEKVCQLVGDGARWGLRVEVRSEMRELTIDEARQKYRLETPGSEGEAVVIDYLPQLPGHPLFESYASWIGAVERLLAKQLFPTSIGLRELKPGVWVGRRTHLAPDAELLAPCWLGENVWVDSGAILGPNTIVENRAFIGKGAHVSHSLVGPETLVGENTEVKASIAWGSKLINWRTNSALQVPDPWLLCALGERHVRLEETELRRQLGSWLVLGLSLPVGAMGLLKSKLDGVPALRRLTLKH